MDFYVDVLRGSLIRQPLQGINIRGDDVENILFQKELLDSENWQVPRSDLGIANISSSGDMRLDLRLVKLLSLLLQQLLLCLLFQMCFTLVGIADIAALHKISNRRFHLESCCFYNGCYGISIFCFTRTPYLAWPLLVKHYYHCPMSYENPV